MGYDKKLVHDFFYGEAEYGLSEYESKATESKPSEATKTTEPSYKISYPKVQLPSERQSAWETVAESVSLDPYESYYPMEKPPEKKDEKKSEVQWDW